MDIDLRVPVLTGVPAPVGVPPPSGPSSVALNPSKSASVLPPTITTSALEKSMSILSSLTSDIASDAASPPVKSRLDAAKDKDVSSSGVSGNKNEDKSKLTKLGAIILIHLLKPKGFYVDHGGAAKEVSNKVVSDSVTLKKDKNVKSDSVSVNSGDDKSEKSDSEKTKQSAQHEIVSQLMAEVSGKAITDSKTAKKAAGSEIQDESPESKSEEKEKTEQSTKQVPNVAALFKGLANTDAGSSDKGKKSGIQLPTALMSLFSKLPGSAEEPEEEAPAKIPGLFTAESEELVEDTDLRQSKTSEDKTSVTESKSKKEEKDSEDKLSKSFLGFDYDSDSSGGSFEGFDDDGTKKLSPRKRKYIQKSPHDQSPSTKTNLFGDVDERGTPPAEDIDFREQLDDDVDLRPVIDSQHSDIDERMAIHMAGTSGQPLPPGEGPMHPFPPPGLRLPFMSSSQPLPPGTESSQPLPPGMEWNHLASTSVPAGMQNMPPHTGEWAPPPVPEVSQPPLPAEPPKPKPPEPPVKKKINEEGNRRDDDNSDNEGETKYQSKNSKKKKKKKERKNKKNGQQLSDERIQQIVLEIAKNEPIEPPPMPPMVPQMHGMQKWGQTKNQLISHKPPRGYPKAKPHGHLTPQLLCPKKMEMAKKFSGNQVGKMLLSKGPRI
ncbi:uncharacterized protein DDB_G0284459-like [Ruditapes philippinarum]|uniref:uncharacterized protein DDB_G0284459-like n=1 Tax=Ruditapes philippinarum TaxID=129788 RepID=UPI00295A5A26|nr:uncharacterized protein DDB_G0284459-like [Ruditapes philippinarum]